MSGLFPSDFIGVIPAAGIASRLSPCRYLKELLPVAFQYDAASGTTIPLPVVALSLQALASASINKTVVTISDRKPELLRYLADGIDFGVSLAYVQQPMPTGLAAAVDLARPWTRNANSCLLLPDTIVSPGNAMSKLRAHVESNPCDLALAVLPTAIPEQLGPVRFRTDGVIQEVLDKPTSTDLRNTWGAAIWSPYFTEFLHTCLATHCSSISLGAVFNLAVQSGLSARALWFPEGRYDDVGTFKGISRAMSRSSEEELNLIPAHVQTHRKEELGKIQAYL